MSNFKEDFVIKYFTYEESYNHVGTTGHSYNRNGKYYVGTKIYDNGNTSSPYWTRTSYRGTTVGATGPADYIAAAETIAITVLVCCNIPLQIYHSMDMAHIRKLKRGGARVQAYPRWMYR